MKSRSVRRGPPLRFRTNEKMRASLLAAKDICNSQKPGSRNRFCFKDQAHRGSHRDDGGSWSRSDRAASSKLSFTYGGAKTNTKRPWYLPYGFASRVVRINEHDPKHDLYAGESNVCCPKCEKFIQGSDVTARRIECGHCGHVGHKNTKTKSRGRK